jgi:multiple antibiotic resistance protein
LLRLQILGKFVRGRQSARMWHEFLYAVGISIAAMFPIVNPVGHAGHAPMFFAMTAEESSQFRRAQALKISLWVTAILATSLLLGRWVLDFFGITLDDLRIAGGLLVAHTAWGMLNNQSRVTNDEHAAAADKTDIALTPMATPILAGPGSMSLAIGMSTYGSSWMNYGGYLLGFTIIGLITWASFLSAERLVRFLGVNGAGALNRILGLFILAIAVNLVLTGMRNILSLRATAPELVSLLG